MDVFMQMMNYVAKRPYESPQVDAVSVALEGFIALSIEGEIGWDGESLTNYKYYEDENIIDGDIW